MPGRRFPLFLKILIFVYLILGAFALAVALWDPASDPLAAIYLVLVAVPWTLVLSWIMDDLRVDSHWFNMVFLSAGILINALLLFGLGRFLQRRNRPSEQTTGQETD
jgi:hypothetical protein